MATNAATPSSVVAQRAAALQHGDSIRKRRAELKRDLRARRHDAGEELARVLLDPPAYLQSARIFDVLGWLPGIKGPRADVILNTAGVTGALRTVGELTPRQRDALAELVRLPASAAQPKKAARNNRPVVPQPAPVLDDIAI